MISHSKTHPDRAPHRVHPLDPEAWPIPEPDLLRGDALLAVLLHDGAPLRSRFLADDDYTGAHTDDTTN